MKRVAQGEPFFSCLIELYLFFLHQEVFELVINFRTKSPGFVAHFGTKIILLALLKKPDFQTQL